MNMLLEYVIANTYLPEYPPLPIRIVNARHGVEIVDPTAGTENSTSRWGS